MTGVGFEYLWPNALWMQTGGLSVLMMMAAFNAIMFARRLLALESCYKKTDRLLVGLAMLCLVACLAFPFMRFNDTLRVCIVIGLPAACLLISLGWVRFTEGYRPAKYYFSAWIFVFIAVILFALESTGLVQGSYLSKWALQVGVSIESLLFAVALTSRINLSRQAALEAQQSVIEHQNSLRELQDQANRQLERKVEERTRELAKVVSDLERANEQLDKLSQLDDLTRLLNRRSYNRRSLVLFEQMKQQRQSVAVLFIDIDNMEKINDEYGYMAGDESLREVSGLLKKMIPDRKHLIARYSGDSFVVLLSNTGTDHALELAEQIRQKIAALPCGWEHHLFHVTASIGVHAGIPEADQRMENYTEKANQACSLAKSQGKNKVVTYSS